MARAILELGDVTIATSDPATVQTLYALIGTVIGPEDARTLERVWVHHRRPDHEEGG